MPTNDKTIIWVGNTFPVEFECLEPVAEDENSFTFAYSAIFPSSAYVELWSVNDQALVNISAGADPTQDPADIDGNVVSYILDGAYTQTSGDYKLFTTVIFPDGQEVCEVRQFRVKDKQ